MPPVILLLSTAVSWLGTARMARSLARAGFVVALLAPDGSLAASSRFVARRSVLPRDATPAVWLKALIRAVDDFAPALVVPCDEMAVRLLFVLTLEPPSWLPSTVHLRLAALVERSMGNRAHFLDSVDKLRLPAAAEAAGVAMPPHALAGSVAEARDFAQARGYPVVVKRRYGFAGEGVAVVAGAGELAPAVEALLRPDQLDLGQRQPARLLVQSFVTGPYHSQALVAWDGTTLAGFGWERYVATEPVKGQTSVLRFVRSEETRALAQRLGRAFGITGFFNAQFVIDAATGRAYLLEINRRLVTHMHVGERIGVDLATALRARLAGEPVPAMPSLPAATGPVVTVFPREWLRNPRSRYLVDCPVDVPWDDPELIEAMLAMRPPP